VLVPLRPTGPAAGSTPDAQPEDDDADGGVEIERRP
jgi:hypothetical protein